jgi:hypothetical protein
LINEFEKDDEIIFKRKETEQKRTAEAKAMAMTMPARGDIIDTKDEKNQLLNDNITATRQEWASRMPGMIEDLNEKIIDPRYKLYLR